MNRLRKDRVIVDLAQEEEKTKDAFDQTKSGLFVEKDVKRDAFLTKGTVVHVGHEINPQDISVGMVVYVKKFQGERLTPENEQYMFLERDIVGND